MFGEVLKRVIGESGLSLTRISRVSGISRSMLYKVIKGESVISDKKFTELINTKLFSQNQIEDLVDAFILTSTGNGDGKGIIRAQTLIENLQNNHTRKIGTNVAIVKSEGYQVVDDHSRIQQIISYSLDNCQKEALILIQEKARIEKYIPETAKNITVLKNISDPAKKIHNLNDGLLACLRNPDLGFYYTTVLTLNISIYDNYVLADDVLFMYNCNLTLMSYTSNPIRILFFKKIFFERMDSASRYFKVEPLNKAAQEVYRINESQSILEKDQHYYIKNGNKMLSLDKMLEQDLHDYFSKGVKNG